MPPWKRRNIDQNHQFVGFHISLVGGFNPSEKYARQIGSSPQVGVKNLKKYPMVFRSVTTDTSGRDLVGCFNSWTFLGVRSDLHLDDQKVTFIATKKVGFMLVLHPGKTNVTSWKTNHE